MSGLFPLLTTMKNDMNIHVHIFAWTFVFISLGLINLAVELLGHMITLSLIVWRTARVFSKLPVPLYILIRSV